MEQRQSAGNFFSFKRSFASFIGGGGSTKELKWSQGGWQSILMILMFCLFLCFNSGFGRKFYVFMYLSVGKGDILATQIKKRLRNLERDQAREMSWKISAFVIRESP